jgi:uncharacterized membrane protein
VSQPRHPVVVQIDAERAHDPQLRIADRVSAFVGSMQFVYLHLALFGGWMLFVERSPWPSLALAASLEAIFLSTFVLIGQNRQAQFQQAKADHEFSESEQELKLNTALTQQVHDLTREIHRSMVEPPGAAATPKDVSLPGWSGAPGRPRRGSRRGARLDAGSTNVSTS